MVCRSAFLLSATFILAALPLPANADGTTKSAEDSAFEISVQRPKDTVTARLADERAVFTIKSPFGIGSAVIRRRDERWPKEVVFQIHLRGLESFTMAQGNLKLAISVSSAGDNTRLVHLWKDGKEGPRLTKDSPFWADVKIVVEQDGEKPKIPLNNGYFEVGVPKALLEDSPQELTIGWIDFYR